MKSGIAIYTHLNEGCDSRWDEMDLVYLFGPENNIITMIIIAAITNKLTNNVDLPVTNIAILAKKYTSFNPYPEYHSYKMKNKKNAPKWKVLSPFQTHILSQKV